MALDITTVLTTAITGLMGVLVGAVTNHQLSAKYNRKDLIFKRKLEYFEKVVETMEKNKKIYYNILRKIQNSKNKKEIEKIVKELKENRENFFIMASPLYFNTERFSERIKSFVVIEKDIFESISTIQQNSKDKTIKKITDDLEGLNKKSQEIIFNMKIELMK
jgi:hypothetical protein